MNSRPSLCCGRRAPSVDESKSRSSAGRARRGRDSLSRDVILEAARAIAVRDGLDGLTFQAIGRELEAHPTSVYRHYRDKDELRST